MQLFIKATDTVFGPETESFLTKYVDDLRVVSRSWRDHLDHLLIVFSSVIKVGMTLKFDKCSFIQEEVEYLGFIISKNGVMKNPEKLKAILKFPTPKNKKTLQSFIGLVNFYRKFHLGHSQLLAPLFHLLKKDEPWRWTSEEERGFVEIKKAFTENVVLSYPDLSKPFFLNTDASALAIAGELYQLDSEGNRRHIFFYSRVLTDSEKNYTVTEQELLAIVVSCVKFRQIILGHRVMVSSDHQALTFFRQATLTSGRLTRWSLFLQQFDLEINHVKGSENTAIDTLSRFPPEYNDIPLETPDINVYKVFSPELKSDILSKIPELLPSDPFFGTIIQKLEEKDETLSNLYFLNESKFLFFKRPNSDVNLLCCPAAAEAELIRLAHEFLGHLGVSKVHNYLRTFVLMPDMRRKIHKFIAACLDCLKSKPLNVKNTHPLVPVLANSCKELVSVDLYGPLPRSFGNFSYILVAVDVFSKFVKLIPLKNATGLIVTRNFIKHFVEPLGAPVTVIADHGPCFRSHVWDRILKSHNIQPRHTSVYHPQSNPAERYMKILGSFFRIYCHQKHRNWINYLSFLENCINNSVNESTGCAPVEIFAARSPQNFLNSILNFPPSSFDHKAKLVLAESNLRKSANRRKSRHDKKVNMPSYGEGDMVLLRSHHLSDTLKGEIENSSDFMKALFSLASQKDKTHLKL